MLERGRIFDALGLYAEAEADFSEAQTLIPHDPMIPFMRGLMFFLGGDLDRAVVLCRESMHPDVKDVWRCEMQAILDKDSRYADLRAALSA